MKVYWTATAERHLDSIYEYIARDSQWYALKTVDRITRRSWQIAEFPLSGRRVPEYDSEWIREVFEGPYRIVYHIASDRVDVVAVIHGMTAAFGIPGGDGPAD